MAVALARALQELEARECSDRQFHCKSEGLMRGSLAKRFTSEKSFLQSKTSCGSSVSQLSGQKNGSAKVRRRVAGTGPMAFTDFLKATNSVACCTSTSQPDNARSASPTSIPLAPSQVSKRVTFEALHNNEEMKEETKCEATQKVSVSCSNQLKSINSPNPEEVRRQIAARRALAFAHLLPPQGTEAKETPAKCSAPSNPSVTETELQRQIQQTQQVEAQLASALATIQRLRGQMELQPPQPKETQREATQQQRCTSSMVEPDYPSWLVEADFDEEEFVMVDKEECLMRCSTWRPSCTSCYKALNVITWLPGESRHHCALCGKVLCNDCSSYWTILPHMGSYAKQRACKECHMRATGNRTPHPSLLEPRSCIEPEAPITRLVVLVKNRLPCFVRCRWFLDDS